MIAKEFSMFNLAKGRHEVKSRLLLLLLAVIFTVSLSGCPALWNMESSEVKESPEDAYKNAQDLLKDKKYFQAIESLEKLKSAHPDFKEMPEVYVKIADAFFDEGSYDKAIARYLQFLELYPNNADVPRAKYQIGMAYFNQIKGTDLDNSVVRSAIQAFKVVTELQDSGDWGKKAEERINECKKKLAEKELYKANTYVSLGNYKAARLAAQRVLDDYPKLGFDDVAEELIKKYKNR